MMEVQEEEELGLHSQGMVGWRGKSKEQYAYLYNIITLGNSAPLNVSCLL